MKSIRQRWMKEKFIPSFGICESKRITEKQAEIFKRYLEHIEYRDTLLNRYGDDYIAKCDNLIIQLFERMIGRKRVFTITIKEESKC